MFLILKVAQTTNTTYLTMNFIVKVTVPRYCANLQPAISRYSGASCNTHHFVVFTEDFGVGEGDGFVGPESASAFPAKRSFT